MTQYISWFNKIRMGMSIKGLTVKGILHHAYPVRECPKCGAVFGDGYCPTCDSSAAWRQTNCLKSKCGSINAFVFQSDVDEYEFFIFCQKCNKWELVQGLPDKPIRSSRRSNAPVDMGENEPPPIGSLTKPV